MATVEFYFDYLSPYAYLASLEIGPLCRRHGAALALRPVLFAGLLNHWGQRGPAEIPPKGLHALRDCLRYATLRGVPLRPPRFHPFRPLSALRVSLAEVSGDDQPRVVSALYQLGWARGGDLGSDEEMRAALDEAGLDGGALLSRAAEPEAKQALRDQTEAAVANGVFGIPTMRVAGELFWGLDQLRWLELFLDGRDPLDKVDQSSIRNQGRAAWRTGIKPLDG